MTLSEKTLVPLGFVFMVIGGVLGAVMWLTTIYGKVEASAQTIQEISKRQDKYYDTVEQINSRLSSIEGELKRITH